MQRATLKARIAGSIGAVALAAGMTVALGGTAGAATPSDPRADFHDGNVVNCSQIGLPDSTLAFANGTDSIDDGNVSGEVVDGTTVNVDDPPAGVVIDAVVVKGGAAYNVYSTASGDDNGNHVPPAEDTPTEYISPLNGGGNVPTVSHWFICYHSETPPETGSLAVTKIVTPPADPTAVVPTSFTVHVQCSDGTSEDLMLPISDGEGGLDFTGVVTGIADGATCVISETSPVPTGTVTSYAPAGDATSSGEVEIVGGAQSEASVTNDFTNVPGAPVAPQPVAVTPAFTG